MTACCVLELYDRISLWIIQWDRNGSVDSFWSPEVQRFEDWHSTPVRSEPCGHAWDGTTPSVPSPVAQEHIKEAGTHLQHATSCLTVIALELPW